MRTTLDIDDPILREVKALAELFLLALLIVPLTGRPAPIGGNPFGARWRRRG
jgi:hypothetical protein